MLAIVPSHNLHASARVQQQAAPTFHISNPVLHGTTDTDSQSLGPKSPSTSHVCHMPGPAPAPVTV
jgi:hypothetical protein